MTDNRLTWLLVALLVCTAPGNPVWAQDEDDPYRLTLRNIAPDDIGATEGAVTLKLQDPDEDSDPENVHALVQLYREALQPARSPGESRDALKRLFEPDQEDDNYIRLLRPVQGTTYEAVMRRTLADDLADPGQGLAVLDDEIEALIRWIGSVPVEAKYDPDLLAGNYFEWGIGPNGTFRLLVTFYKDVTPRVAGDVLTKVNAVAPDQTTDDTWRLLLPRNQLDRLARDDSVRLIAQGPQPFRPANERSRAATNVESVQDIDLGTDPPTYNGLSGAGVTVAIMDTPVDTEHDDFWEHDEFGHRTVARVQDHSGAAYDSMHGTHVAGTIGGNGYQSDKLDADGDMNDGSEYQWRGMAPHTSLLSFDKEGDANIVLTRFYDAIELGGAGVSNHSYEKEGCYKYEVFSETIDDLVNGSASWSGTVISARAIVWAAGNRGKTSSLPCRNRGYFGLTTASKNAIVVAATNSDDGLRYPFGSLGPSYDGRLKPDVVAPGCTSDQTVGIKSTSTTDPAIPDATPNGYFGDCGTSMAAPAVTGTIALLLEIWQQEFCSLDSVCYPLPSTLKAVLIQGATDLDGQDDPSAHTNPDTEAVVQYHPGPDYATGYGLVNAEVSAALVDAGPGINRRIIESEIYSTVEPNRYIIDVGDGAPTLRVTLAWDDVAANTSTTDDDKKLMHDLDLELVSPADTVFFPWEIPTMTPATDVHGNALPYADDPIVDVSAQPGTDDDDVNNVEQVVVADSAEGQWQVRVKGNKLPFGSSQKFSLVANFPVSHAGWRPPDVAIDDDTICDELDWMVLARSIEVTFPDMPACGAVPVEPICQYVVNCVGCDGFGYCPDMALRLTGVPESLRVEVRNRNGDRVAAAASGYPDRTLTWERLQGDNYGLFFIPDEDATVSGKFILGMSAIE